MPINRDEELGTVDEQGKPVKNRISNAGTAHKIFKRLKRNQEIVAVSRAKIQGLIDGNAPYSPSELTRIGQSWRSNVNFREAEAIIHDNAASYWELLMEVPTLVRARVDFDSPTEDDLVIEWAEIIAEEFTRILRDWHGFFYETLLYSTEMLKFGKGITFWRDEHDWRFRSAKTASVLVPKKARSNVEEQNLILIRDELPIDDLFDVIDKAKEDKKHFQGWNIPELKQTIINVFNKNEKKEVDARYQLSDWEDVQQRIKNNDWTYDETDFDGLRVVHELIQEVSGKITHVIIQEDNEPENFLYKRDERFGDMTEVICFFFFDLGDGYYHSVKGLGHRIYPHIEISNRFINSSLDGAMVSASILLQPATGSGTQDTRLLRIGPVTVIPSGYQAVQSTFQPQINGMIAMRGMLQQILNNNTGVFKPAPEVPEPAEKTATQVEFEARREARFTKNQISLYYVQWDKLLKEIFRRLVNTSYPPKAGGYDDHEKFIKRCVDRGVPEEALDLEHVTIIAARAIGFGSANLRSMIARELFAVRNAFDDRGQMNIKRDYLASLVGQNNVDRYAPARNRNLIPVNEHSIATLENNDFAEGKPVPVGTDQMHGAHAIVHLRPLTEVAQLFIVNPAGVDMPTSVQMAQVAIPHIATHLGLLSRDPAQEQQAKQLSEVLDSVSATFAAMNQEVQTQVQAQAAQMQEAAQVLQQAQQQVQSDDLREKLAGIEKDFQLEMFRQRGISEIRRLKAETTQAMKQRESDAKIERLDKESEAKIREE